MTAARKNRRLRFGLGAFLVTVAVFGSSLGSALHWLKERERVVESFASSGGFIRSRTSIDKHAPRNELPFILSVLGATEYDCIGMPESAYHSKAPGAYNGFEGYLLLETLFPEARIVVVFDQDKPLP
ncbi:MAG: hypothetical protein AB7O59_06945 [Pirellulales bacterium]